MIKAVLFDLDGTLLDRDESVKKFIDNQHDRLHKWLRHVPKKTYATRFIELDQRGYVWKDNVYQQLAEKFNIKGMTWEDLLQDYLAYFADSCIPFPNVQSTLDELKKAGLSLGMITNGKGQFQMDNIKALGIDHYFDVILISEWEGIKKPDPQIFERALERMNVAAGESLFVGDHPENDIKAARHAGMMGIWKKDAQWECAEADFVVEDLAEIPFIIQSMDDTYY